MGAARRTWRQRFADWFAGWWESRPPMAVDQVSMARQIRANQAEIAALQVRDAAREAELTELKDWKAAHERYGAAWAKGFAQSFAAAGLPVPDVMAAEAPTITLDTRPLRRVV